MKSNWKHLKLLIYSYYFLFRDIYTHNATQNYNKIDLHNCTMYILNKSIAIKLILILLTFNNWDLYALELLCILYFYNKIDLKLY